MLQQNAGSIFPFEAVPEDFSPVQIEKSVIINLINHLHFKGSHLSIYLHHAKLNRYYLIKASPDPCIDESFMAKLDNNADIRIFERDFHVLGIIIEYGRSLLFTKVIAKNLEENQLSLRLLECNYSWSRRKTKRYQCLDTKAILSQSGNTMKGVIFNFSSAALGVDVDKKQSDTLTEIDPYTPISMEIKKGERSIISNTYRIIKLDNKNNTKRIILDSKPLPADQVSTRRHRNIRASCLTPSPRISFIHPILLNNVSFEICDISVAGFSVLDSNYSSCILQGMIIDEITISYPGEIHHTCKAKVLYISEHSETLYRYGFVFLDMSMEAYTYLFSMICPAEDPHISSTAPINSDSLWEFLFESGFIYQKKYHQLISYRERIVEAYYNLYSRKHESFHRITYERNGKIYGHISMIKAYPRVWMVHHLAAIPMDGKYIGLSLLRQIIMFFDGCFRIPSSDTDFVILYYRPENRFPEFFFTGACKATKNKRACSSDLFDYILFSVQNVLPVLPDGWDIKDCSPEDLSSLKPGYDSQSGGLLIDLLTFIHQPGHQKGIQQDYGKMGMHRNYSLYSLKNHGKLCAVFLVDQSDIGLNLSELLNCVKIFLMDNQSLGIDILKTALHILGSVYGENIIPALIYPSGWIKRSDGENEKKYRMLIIHKKDGLIFLDKLKRIGKLAGEKTDG